MTQVVKYYPNLCYLTQNLAKKRGIRFDNKGLAFDLINIQSWKKNKIVGLTRGVFGKPGYLHATVKMSDEQDREIARRIDARLQKTGEKYISNNDHWDITMEVLRETKNKR